MVLLDKGYSSPAQDPEGLVKFLIPHKETDLTDRQKSENATHSKTRKDIEGSRKHCRLLLFFVDTFGRISTKFKAWRKPWRHCHEEFNPCLHEICALWNCNEDAQEKELDRDVQNHALFAHESFDLEIYLSTRTRRILEEPTEWGTQFMDIEDDFGMYFSCCLY